MPKAYTLGLDLGATSIGWAIIDEANSEVIAGVRIFQEGVERDQKGGEKSKNEQRRTARGQRRQIARRARKRRLFRRLLTEQGWLTADNIDTFNPYELRAKGLTQQLTLPEFARVLIHLNKRRGFLSNRKTDRVAKDSEQSKLVTQMNQLAQEISDQGCATLGEYLAKRHAEDPYSRIRGQHTRRDMFISEFAKLWEKQATFQPDVLTSKLRDKIFGILFFQRKMYWPASSIGKCELEPRYERCSRADRLFQRVRMLQEVNNLRILDPMANERPLTADERTLLLEELRQVAKFEFNKMRKMFGLTEGFTFNYERGKRDSLQGMTSDFHLSKIFGKNWWELPEEKRDRIVRFLLNHDGDDEKIKRVAKDDWQLDDKAINKLFESKFQRAVYIEGRARHSHVAMKNLLPYLEKGLPLMTVDGTESAMNQAGYLRPDQHKVNQCQELPMPPFITNPIVRQGMFEVRKVVNAIIREYGMPAHIHIELAREIKGNSEKRQQISLEQWKRKNERVNAANELAELNTSIMPNRENIARYLLWKEQREICTYSGKSISFHQVYNGDTEIDHILPYSRSLDDSFMNKVLVFRDENKLKGNQTPYEWLAGAQEEKHKKVLQLAASFPIGKKRKFNQKEVELDTFLARQLVDTQYVSREVTRYVRSLDVDVVCTKGGKTADLRYLWGLNDLLNTSGENKKTRDDHRHHAVDAIVIALTNRSRLHQLSRRYDGGTMEEPWPTFRHDVIKAIEAINVSHRPTRKVSGPLHEETIYGRTDEEGIYVYRKPLESLNTNEVEKIRDHVVRELVRKRLAEHGISCVGKAAKIPKEAWAKPLLMRMKKGSKGNPIVIKKVRLLKPEKSVVPLRQNSPVHVKPGSIHHVSFFERLDSRGKPKKEAIFVSMLEAARRASKGEPLIERTHPEYPEARFLFSLSRNDMMMATFKDKELLVRYVTGASTQGQLYFAEHTDARPSGTAKKYVASAGTLVANKVTVDVLGRIRWAND